jgi:hypothetical protein
MHIRSEPVATLDCQRLAAPTEWSAEQTRSAALFRTGSRFVA